MTPLFRLFAWPQRLLLIGPGAGTDSHSHHAAQVCVGLDAPLSMRSSPGEEWQEAQGFFVPANQPHQLDAGGRPAAFLYLEADSDECRRYATRRPAGLEKLPPAPAWLPLLRAVANSGDPNEAQALVAAILEASRGPAPVQMDRRISAAQEWIGSHLSGTVRIADAAEAVQLSESHFAHLFSEQVGMPLRRYVLWRRLREALAGAMRGDSLTVAAHSAGFADSAHLSRTFRDHFGVAPSFLFEHRRHIAYVSFE